MYKKTDFYQDKLISCGQDISLRQQVSSKPCHKQNEVECWSHGPAEFFSEELC